MTRRGAALFVLMSVIWGMPYLFIRLAVAGITPATLVFSRTLLAAVILIPVALAGGGFRPTLARWRWLAAFALVEVAIPWVALGSAEQRVASSLAGLMVAAVPLIGTVIGVALGSGERMSKTGGMGLVLGLLGVAAIAGFNFGSSDLLALVEISVVVVGYALGPVILATRLRGLPPVAVMSSSLGLCAVLFAPIAAFERPASLPSLGVLISVAILGVICTAVAFPLFAALINEVGAVRATVITYVNPAVAALLGVLILHERFTIVMGFGFGLVVLGSVFATQRANAAPSTSTHSSSSNPENAPVKKLTHAPRPTNLADQDSRVAPASPDECNLAVELDSHAFQGLDAIPKIAWPISTSRWR